MDVQTHETWIKISSDSDFSYHNIPFGIFSTADNKEDARPATRVGDFIFDLREIERQGLFNGELFSKLTEKVFQGKTLNAFMGLTRPYWREVRKTLQNLLHVGSVLDTNQELRNKIVIANSDKIALHLPAQIGDYTDFYSSYSHAYNVGVMFRGKDNAIQPNWLHVPIGYHGRASSIVVSGTEIRRPRGQTKPPTAEKPGFTECKRLDYELEVAAFVGGPANKMGDPIKVNEAEERVFGIVLMNDWSARDIQAWEYVPLGPFNGKNFGTTISPWVVTLDALDLFRVDLQAQDPEPLPYLKENRHTSFDIKLDVLLQAEGSTNPDLLAQSNYKYMYWNIAQQLTHHSVGGCIMNPGDLLGSGTISGPEKHEYGSMLELSWSGSEKIPLSEGKERTFILDHDTIIMKGTAEKNGIRVGFGECTGKIIPALPENQYY